MGSHVVLLILGQLSEIFVKYFNLTPFELALKSSLSFRQDSNSISFNFLHF